MSSFAAARSSIVAGARALACYFFGHKTRLWAATAAATAAATTAATATATAHDERRCAHVSARALRLALAQASPRKTLGGQAMAAAIATSPPLIAAARWSTSTRKAPLRARAQTSERCFFATWPRFCCCKQFVSDVAISIEQPRFYYLVHFEV